MHHSKRFTVLALLLVISLAQVQIQQHFDYIIVGMGAAGLGASVFLDKKGENHLILEAKNRIGGRINSFQFNGNTQDEGAGYIHEPYSGNWFHDYAAYYNVGQVAANWANQDVYYTNMSTASQADLNSAQTVYNNLQNFSRQQWNNMYVDDDMHKILTKFWNQNPQYSGWIKNRVSHEMHEQSNDEGADLNQMSTWEWYGGHDGLDVNDYAPAGGFHQLFNTIYNGEIYNNVGTLHLSEVVGSVDYSGSNIVVTTNKATYTTTRLLFSPSLGTLKAGSVQFTPSLPNKMKKAINGIGFNQY